MFPIFQLILWISLITVFTLIGSWYAKKYNRADALIALFVGFVVFSNIVVVKMVEYNLFGWKIYATAATLIFSVTFLMTDIVNEKFGIKETYKMIYIAFFVQVALAIFSYLVILLTPAPFWTQQDAFAMLLGQVPRIMLASWIAFLLSENIDAILFDWFKKKTKGKHLWARNAFSSLPSMVVDSVVFVVLAFYGTMSLASLLSIIFGVTLLKWIVGIINIPFMYLNRWVMIKK